MELYKLFKALIRKQNPHYIVEASLISVDGLHVAVCKYVKGGKWYIATTYFTNVWVGKTLFQYSGGATMNVNTLYDIADVKEYSSEKEWASQQIPTKGDLEILLSTLQSEVNLRLSAFDFLHDEDKLVARLETSPLPILSIVGMNGHSLLGSCIIVPSGVVQCTMSCVERWPIYISKLKQFFGRLQKQPKLGSGGGKGFEPVSFG